MFRTAHYFHAVGTSKSVHVLALSIVVAAFFLLFAVPSAHAENSCQNDNTDERGALSGGDDQMIYCRLNNFNVAGNSPFPSLLADWNLTPIRSSDPDQLYIINNLYATAGTPYLAIIVDVSNQPGGGPVGTFSQTPTNPNGDNEQFVFTPAQAASGITVTLTQGGLDYYFEIRAVDSGNARGIDTIQAFTIIQGTPPSTAVADTGSQALSQQILGSSILLAQSANNISAGIGNAVSERFFGGDGTQGSFNDAALNAYVSLHGIGAAARDMRAARLAMYGGGPQALNAIETALGQPEDANAEQVSPYLLGADVVPLADTGPDVVRLNAWVRGTYTHYDGDSFSGDTWNGVAGMDYLLTDDLLIGVLAGYENGDFDFDTTNGAFEGSGFTAGVYVGARLSESIVADAFLTHSWLDYDTRAGTATGSTDASRWLVSMNVTGSYGLTDTLILEPNVRVFYAHETQDGYTLSDATVVAENSIDSGRLSLGPRLRYLVAEDWSAFISAHGEYDLSSETQTNTTLPDFDGLLSARIGLGVDGMFWNGWSLSLAGDVSGIGSGDYLAYTGTGKIRVPLN